MPRVCESARDEDCHLFSKTSDDITQEYGVTDDNKLQTAPADLAALMNARWSDSVYPALTCSDFEIVSAATHTLEQLQMYRPALRPH